jgi:parvulin-like peptidyl-prolyl isomerase
MFLRRSMLLVVGLGLAACDKSVPDAELVAKVNGEGISKVEFEAEVERNMARYRGQGHTLPPGIEQRIRESVLRRMIDDVVIALKAKSLNADVTVEELAGKFDEHKKRFRTDQAFQDYLKRSSNTEENMKADLKRNLLRDRVVEKMSGAIDVTDEEVGKYYEENKARFTEKEQIKASRILIRLPDNPTDADKKKLKAEAKAVRTKVTAKNADFGEIAKTASKGPEASRAGDLGWLTRGRMPPEFDNVAFTLAANTVSDVVETKFGYEIIKVFEKKAERQRAMDEVKDNIKNSLLARKRNEKRREVLRDLKKDAKVEQLIQFEHTPAGPASAGGPGEMGAPGGMPGMPGAPGMPMRPPLPIPGGAGGGEMPAPAPGGEMAPPAGEPAPQ